MSQRQQAASYVGQQCCGLRVFSGECPGCFSHYEDFCAFGQGCKTFFFQMQNLEPQIYDTQQITDRTST